MRKFVLCFAIFLLSISFGLADFYSSMTKVDYDKNTLNFTTKMNARHISTTVEISPDAKAFSEVVRKYVDNNFHVSVNGSDKKLHFTKVETLGQTVWVYYQIGNVESVSSLKIKNTLLFNYSKQLNLVNIIYNGVQKTMAFKRGKDTSEVTF